VAFYRTEADTPDRNVADAVWPSGRIVIRGGVAGGSPRDGIAGSEGDLAGVRLHACADALGLFGAGHQPRRVMPCCSGAGARLAGITRGAELFAGHRSLLQGAGALAGAAVRPAGAGNRASVTSGSASGLALARTPGETRGRHHGDDAGYRRNQAVYPQQSAQQPGLGFPIARIVVVFCLACGTVLDAALGRHQGKKTGENTLLRSLDAFEPSDVLLADRCFSGYFDIACWQQQGVDVVTQLHQRRSCDLRRGRRLGPDDHIIIWTKPQRPSWMDEETYANMPDLLVVREVRVRIAVPGFRTKVVVVVTTLLDAQEYSPRDLAELYRARWHAELDLRSLKITLGMDVLRCKKPEMVRKEIWAHLLAYNLIRTLMARAAEDIACTPRDLSFKGTLQTMKEFADRLLDARGQTREQLYDWLLVAIAAHQVNDRPNRVEPRARKRRRKQYSKAALPAIFAGNLSSLANSPCEKCLRAISVASLPIARSSTSTPTGRFIVTAQTATPLVCERLNCRGG